MHENFKGTHEHSRQGYDTGYDTDGMQSMQLVLSVDRRPRGACFNSSVVRASYALRPRLPVHVRVYTVKKLFPCSLLYEKHLPSMRNLFAHINANDKERSMACNAMQSMLSMLFINLRASIETRVCQVARRASYVCPLFCTISIIDDSHYIYAYRCGRCSLFTD